jgi:hypothetical protein
MHCELSRREETTTMGVRGRVGMDSRFYNQPQHIHRPAYFSMRKLEEVISPSEHFPHEDAGSAQEIQFTEQQTMSWGAEGSTDLPSTWGALWCQIVRYGFRNELSMCSVPRPGTDLEVAPLIIILLS